MAFLKKHWTLIGALWIAFVFVQSLFFKFTDAPESIYIFQTIADWLGLSFFEPWGRYGVGTTELIASVLVFIPALRAFGALLALGVMTGAIFFHLFSPLGIEVAGDGGTLFIMACSVWLVSAAIVIQRKKQLKMVLGGHCPFKSFKKVSAD